MKIDAIILGAAGFGGGELLRLLAQHGGINKLRAVSRTHAGRPVHAVHPHLRGVLDLVFESDIDWSTCRGTQPVVFSAMPSLAFAAQYSALETQWREAGVADRILCIDLSGDFRLADADAFRKHYGASHPCAEVLGSFVYGLAEWRPERIASAKRIANPGCFATAIELALLPLAGLGALGRVCVSAMTGSSGSGASPSASTHHATRANDLRAYKVLAHQHLGEIDALLAAVGMEADVSFVPHSAPMVRGIFATLQFDLHTLGIDGGTFMRRYETFCGAQPFVDLVDDTPHIATVAGTNRCELAVHVNGRNAVALSAIDNLGKGMAGQAIQNMNIALGVPQQTGLQLAAVWP